MYNCNYSKCVVQPRSRPRFTFTDSAVVWSFPISLWAQEKWVKDETDTQIKAFENDWNYITDKLPKAIKDNAEEQGKIKNIVKDK